LCLKWIIDQVSQEIADMKILLGGAINLSRISVTIDKAIMCGKTNKFFIKK